MSETAEVDLEAFCADPRRDPRTVLHRPFVKGEWLCAMDGTVGVCVPSQGQDETPNAPDFPGILGSGEDEVLEWLRLEGTDGLESRLSHKFWPCARCEGCGNAGDRLTCDCCGGSGECTCRDCDSEHECGLCGGLGYTMEGCRECGGTGDDKARGHQRVFRVGLAWLAEARLDKVLTLPGVEFGRREDGTKLVPLRFKGGRGGVMPLDPMCWPAVEA